MRSGRRSVLVVLATVGVSLGALAPSAFAMPAKLYPTGQSSFVFGSSVKVEGNGATSQKPESKLFFTPDRRWWAVLGTSGANAPTSGLWLFELVDHRWVARHKLAGADRWAKADAKFVAAENAAYVVARDIQKAATTNPRETRQHKLVYHGAGVWSEPEASVLLTNVKPDSATLEKDTQGRMWAAWEEGARVKVKATSPGLNNWFSVDILSGDILSDDHASVIHFGTPETGYKIGVFWSDQVNHRFRFAWRRDGTKALPENWNYETVYGNGVGGCPTANSFHCANNHMNLKAHGDNVYVAVKTHLDWGPTPSKSDPGTLVFRRSAAGTWDHHPVATVGHRASRPIVVLSPERDLMWVFSQKDMNDVYVWESKMSAPKFFAGAWSPWTTGAGSRNDPTSTKQNVPADMPVVVETSYDHTEPNTYDYWHNAFLP